MYSRVLRFAPSPNGHLHLGHAYSALLNADAARELGGRLLLRIEDIDTERCRPEYEQAIYEDLHWLGISWQEPVRRQSEHFADYRFAIAQLDAQGLLYPSFETRRELARKDSPASYHLAVVVDDALQGATDIIRGQDLFWSTGIHRLLQKLLGLPEPTYHHHKLILDETGQKLAKSTNATGLRELRAAGLKPFDIRRMVGLGR